MTFKAYLEEVESGNEIGFVTNIENDTKENDNFRKVIYTAKDLQLVLMSLQPNEDIGEETHENTDQFFRVDEGYGIVLMGDKEHDITNGSAFIIPMGINHNIIAGDDGLKLYTIYSTPDLHKDGEINKTKEDAIKGELK